MKITLAFTIDIDIDKTPRDLEPQPEGAFATAELANTDSTPRPLGFSPNPPFGGTL